MIETSRRVLIHEVSIRLLTRANALGVFPTPVDRLATTADLVLRGELDLLSDKPRMSLPARLREGWNRLRRLTNRSPTLVYLDLAGLPPPQNLLALHGLAQLLLPLFTVEECRSKHEEPSVIDVQEVTDEEAAYFAILILLQHNRFDWEQARLELSLKAGLLLCQLFGSPIHTTLRRMVERSAKRCALLVIERIPVPISLAGAPYCIKKDYLLSEPFSSDFGRLCIPDELTAAGQQVPCKYHFLSRDSLGFVFIMSEREYQFSSIRIELTGE